MVPLAVSAAGATLTLPTSIPNPRPIAFHVKVTTTSTDQKSAAAAASAPSGASSPPDLSAWKPLFEDSIKLLGLDGMNIGAGDATPKPAGSLYGVGQGAFASFKGEIATWKAMGVGACGSDGSVRHRGEISLAGTGATLSKLNSAAVLYEFSIDAQGNTQSTFFEWK